MKLVVVALLAAFALEGAAFNIDRSVMSEKYWSIWNDEVQAKIDADIEKYRKADATFEVAAPDGAEVEVEQIDHAFYFGAQIFNFNQLGKKEWNDRYKELYGTLFNSATVAFYWRTLEVYPYAPRFEERYEDTENFWNSCPHPKDQPHWRRPAVDPVISFLKTRGCRIHGHPLVWGSSAWHTPTWLWDDFCPESEKLALEQASGVKVPRRDFTVPMGVKDMKNDPKGRLWAAAWEEIYKRLSDEEISKLVPTFLKAQNDFYERRIRDIGERYGSRVDSWDVVNESATDYDRFGRKAVRGKPFDRSGYGIMPSDYACKAFTWCQKYLPSTALLNINECNMEPFFEQVDDLIAHGARIDVVGSQMHLFNPAESVNIARGEGPAHLRPEAVAERFRVLSQANRPIHLSEITITAPDNSPRGQMVQAIIMRNLYRAWFSVEKMNGITWWNVVDDCGAPGEPSISGLFTRDMRPKAAYFAMDDLVNREWKTKTTAKASGGKVSFRGFKGRYRLSWKGADGKSHEAYVQVDDNHSAVDKGREITLHDGWVFSRDKKYWKGVRVPHDWAISGPFDQKLGGKTGMLPWKGVGYYRRTLELPPEAAGKYVALRFGGVMANPEVFLNGEKAGGWDYGYMSFEVDVSDKIKFGEKNEILVKADTTKHMSRWYPGAGIYRDVKLVVEDAKDRAIWGSVKITTPEVAPERAKVRVEYRTPARETPVVNEFEVERPILWDVTNPKLYETTICGKKYRYGIRTAKFTANDGFHLNGRRVQLKGVNLHSDLGPLGMAFDRGAMRRQLEIMKDMGVNALRTSHNAPAEEVLDLCDEMGIVVWDECFDKWDGTAGLAPNEPPEELVSRNLRQFVRRDRNHPCVVAWSIGNEIPPRSKDKPAGVFEERCKLFRDAVLSEDATRPVGIGCCFTNSVGRGDYAAMDLTGWNYNELYMPMRDKYPEKPVVYTESASAFSSWGYFPDAPTTNPTNYDPKTVVDVDSYDRCSARWSDIPDMEFARMERDRFVAGEFVWTGIDYLGEPTPNPTLCRSSFFGICDLCAMPKDRYWLYRSHWNDREETVHLLPHWNWEGHEGEKVMVMCYTSGDEAELFVNGRSAGRRKKTRDAGCIVGKGDPSYYKVTERYRLVWEVPYEPGEIKVVAFRDGRSIGEDSRKTAHKAAAVKLTPEQNELADDELGFVKVELVDEKGTVLPLANDRVNFKLEGPGEIVAVGNGSHNGLDSFAETSSHPLYFGRALVIVRRTGGSDLPIKLTASIPSARSATVALKRKNLDVAVDFSTTVGHLDEPLKMAGESASGAEGSPIVFCSADRKNPANLVRSVPVPPEALVRVSDKSVLRRLPAAARKGICRIDLEKLGIDLPKPAVQERYAPYDMPDLQSTTARGWRLRS